MRGGLAAAPATFSRSHLRRRRGMWVAHVVVVAVTQKEGGNYPERARARPARGAVVVTAAAAFEDDVRPLAGPPIRPPSVSSATPIRRRSAGKMSPKAGIPPSRRPSTRRRKTGPARIRRGRSRRRVPAASPTSFRERRRPLYTRESAARKETAVHVHIYSADDAFV